MFHSHAPLLRALLLLLLFTPPLVQCSMLLDTLQMNPIRATCPAERNSVLSSDQSISVHFAAGVDHASAEQLVRLTTPAGPLAGSFSWQEDRLEFHPHSPLTAGCRYALEVSGELQFRDGRTCRVQRRIPFYHRRAPASENPPIRYEPQTGSIIGKQSALNIAFDHQVERNRVIQDLRISPFADYLFQWNQTSTLLSISPLNGWKNHSICRIEFDELSYPSAAYYIEFQEPQELTYEMNPVELDWQANFPPADCSLSAVSAGCTVQFRFSRVVDQQECADAVSFRPFCSGSFFWKDDRTAVFIPDEALAAATTYCCSFAAGSLGGALQDAEFTTAAELPRIIRLQGEAADSIPEDVGALPTTSVDITPTGPEGSYSFLLEYSQSVGSTEARARLQSCAHIRTIFPPDVPAPTVVSCFWPDDTHLLLQLQGLGVQADGRSTYYSFRLPEECSEPAALQMRVVP
ncbi:MAG: hypothetical protein ACOC2R_02690 [Spirochaetota bacterium]